MTTRRNTGLSREERVASLLADIDALPATRRNRRRDIIPSDTDFLPRAYGVVLEAARVRRLSLAAYIRRAVYAMACHDLNLPLSEVLEIDPRMSRETGFPVDDPEGRKFGPWEIEKLKGQGP